MNILLNGVACTGLFFGVTLSLAYTFQNKLLYFPHIPTRLPINNPKGSRNPGEVGLAYEDVHITTKDNLKLHGWFIKNQNSKQVPTVIIYHGRSGNIGNRIAFITTMFKYLSANVFILGYRGYSYSEGKPSEKGLQIDSVAGIEYVFSRDDIDLSKVFVLGSSMGGAVTIHAATDTPYADKLAGIIVENTFTTLPELFDLKYSWAKYIRPLVLANYWHNLERVEHIKLPMLFISGTHDKLIPPAMMKTLYEKATASKFKKLLSVEKGTHVETWSIGEAVYFKGIKDFVDEVIAEQIKK